LGRCITAIANHTEENALRTKLHAEKKSLMWKNVVLGTFAALVLCLFAAPIYAQSADAIAKPAAPRAYDITKEVTLAGTVSSVVKQPTRSTDLAPGSHIMLTTSSGTVDATLGRFAMRGKTALVVTPGESVKLTGVMKTVKGKDVFVTRLVQANGHTYVIRNEHGFANAPATRNGAWKSESKGGAL
jgi:hypothetical protein